MNDQEMNRWNRLVDKYLPCEIVFDEESGGHLWTPGGCGSPGYEEDSPYPAHELRLLLHREVSEGTVERLQKLFDDLGPLPPVEVHRFAREEWKRRTK